MNFEWYVDGVLIVTSTTPHLIVQHLTILHTWLNYTLHHNMIVMIPTQLLYPDPIATIVGGTLSDVRD